MTTVQEAVRRLTIESTDKGVSQTTDKLKNLSKAQDDVAVSATRQERATQSMEKRLESIQRRYDADYRAQKDLTKLQKDLDAARAQGLITQARQNELMGLATARISGLSQATQIATAQATQYAGALGPVGQVLTTIGPAGLAAAAGIGLVVIGMKTASDAANKFADDMGKLGDMAQTLGLTTVQLQAINDEGAKFALTEERIGSMLQRFTAEMDALRQGSGDLFDLTRRIDPALAREMMQARSTAEAIDILARVYEKAGDARQKLDRVIGGRNGGTVGLLIQGIGQQGGVDAVTNSFKQSGDAIDREMIAKVRVLKREIDDMASDAERNIASIFSVPVLQAQHTFMEGFLELSRAAKSFSISDEMKTFFTLMTYLPGKAISAVVDPGQFFRAKPGAANSNTPQIYGGPDEGQRGRGYSALPAPSTAAPALSLEAQIKLQREFNAAMGDAATSSDRLKAKRLELDLALRNNVISQADYNRALGIEQSQESLQLLSRRIGLLGDLAPVSDIVLQKQKEINLANAQGAKITEDETQAIIAKTRAQAEYSKLPNRLQFERDQIGRSDTEATVAARLRGEGLPIDLDSAVAAEIRLNEQLKISKDLAMDFASGFARDLRTGVGLMDALTNAASRLQDRLIDMALNKAISGLVGGGLNFGSLFGGGGGVLPGGAPLGMGGIGSAHSGNATIGEGSTYTSRRYVHPAYFDDARRLHGGGTLGSDEEAFIGKKGEVVGWPSQMAAKYGGKPTVNVKIENYGTDVQTRQDDNGDLVVTSRAVVRDEMGSSRTNSINRSKYGLSPRLRSRA